MPFSDVINSLRSRVMNIIGRAVLEAVNDKEGIQKVKLSLFAGENRDRMERMQSYGFTSRPKPGAEAVVVFPGGNRDHGLVIAIDDKRFRLKSLAEGEVALYTDEGDKIHFKRGNKIVIESQNVELGEGAIEAVIKGNTFQALYNAHTHISGVPTAPTGPPVPLLTGTELSGVSKTK